MRYESLMNIKRVTARNPNRLVNNARKLTNQREGLTYEY